MNSTYRVCFNKARGALMVVNELTKSVQKKGAKTVVAVGLAALAAGAANAAAIDPGAAEHAGKTALAVWSDSNVPANLTADPFTMTGQQANIIAGQKNYADVLKITAGATGSYQNFDISMSATGPTDGKSQDKQLIVVHQVGGDVNFSGDSFKVNATTDFVGGGYNQFSGIYSQAPESQTLEISAAETSIKLTSTAKNGKAVYGISTAGGTVALTGGTVGIEVETNTERSTDEGATNEYSAIIGLGNSSIAGVKGYEEYTGHVTSGEATQISLTVKSNSEKPTVSNNSGAAGGGSPAYGIKLDGGSIDLKGSTTIDVSAVGANAYGVHAQNSEYSTSTGSQTFDSAGVIHNLTVDAKSKTGNAFGFYVMNAADSTNTVTMEATGDVSINASSASGNAFGIYASGKTTTTIGEDGKTVSISASGNKGYGILSSGEGRLTVLGKTIGVDADGAALQGVRAQAGSTVSLGNKRTETVTVTAGAQGVLTSGAGTLGQVDGSHISVKSAQSAGLWAQLGSTLNAGSADTENLEVTGGSWGVLALSEGSVVNLAGKNINVTSTADNSDALYVQDYGTIRVGTQETENITLNGKDAAIMALYHGGAIELTAKTIVMNSESMGVHVQNNSQDVTAPEKASRVNITGETIVLNSKELGFSAFSNGQMNVSGNLTATAANVIDVRGNSTMNINTDGKHTTVLNGDVVFETPNRPGAGNNSGNLINAYVNLGLHGTGSVWTGSAYKFYSYNGEDTRSVELVTPPYYGEVTGFTTEISNGGIWNVTDDSFVNTLNMQGNASIIGTDKVKQFNADEIVVSGAGNKLMFNKDTVLGAQVILK